MMRLLLIRHGVTTANEAGVYCGFTDVHLSESGRSVLEGLKSEVAYPSLAGYRVLTSGMNRTEETLQILYGDVPHEKVPEFMEMNFGLFEMRRYEELCNDPLYIEWITGDNEQNRCPSGESGRDMKARVIRKLHELISEDKDICLVSHGGTVAAIMGELFPKEGRTRYQWQPKNGRGYLVMVENGEVTGYSEI